MLHNIDLILTLTGGLTAALILGLITQKLKLSPIVGYLLAGIIVGPFTPGFVAVLSENSTEGRSCGLSVIIAQKAADSLARTNGAAVRKFREFWLDDFVLQSLMIALSVIIQSELTDGAA